MIKERSTYLRNLIAEYTTLSSRASQAATIQRTRQALKELDGAVELLAAAISTVAPLLDLTELEQLRTSAHTLARLIVRSKDLFPSQTNQTVQLAAAKRDAETLWEGVRSGWKKYANARVQPLREKVIFARQLPSMRAGREERTRILDSLTRRVAELPTAPAHLRGFENDLRELGEHLAALAGDTPEHTSFLGRAVAGTATLDDVTPEILDWCRREGLAGQIKVKL